MRIKSIETIGFGGLPDEKLSIGDGLTVIKGANEAGKSFTIKAIGQGLFGDASTTEKKIRDYCRKWHSEGAFLVRVEVEDCEETFIVERDYENKKNLLKKPGGEEIKDKGKIAALIGDLVGLPTEKAFHATACMRQEEVEALSEERTSIREIIEEKIAGSGSDTEKIVRKLNKAGEAIRSKSGKKGQLPDIDEDIAELENNCSEKRRRLEQLAKDKKDLVHITDELEVKRLQHTDKGKALINSREYINALREERRYDGEFTTAQTNLNKCREAKRQIESSRQSLEDLEVKMGKLTAEIGKAEDYTAADKAWRDKEVESRGLKDRCKDIKDLDKKIAQHDEELKDLVEVDPTELRNAKKLPVEIDSFGSALKGQAFGIEVKPEGDVAYRITADGEPVEGSSAEVQREATIEFPGVASVFLKNLAGGQKPIVDEIKRKEASLEKILDKYGVADVEALEKLDSQRSEKLSSRAELVRSRETLLGDDTLEELEAKSRDTEVELEEAKEKRDKLASFAISDEEMRGKGQEREALDNQKQGLNYAVSECRGILSGVGEDEGELQTRVDNRAKELAVVREKLEQLAPFECTPDEFTRLDREVGELQGRIGVLEREEAVLKSRTSQETIGEEDLAAVEEKLDYHRERRTRLVHKHSVIKVINENIVWARERSISGFSEAIGQRMGEILSAITDEKYDRVEVDGNLGVRVFSREKGDFIDLDKKEDLSILSSGTIDQIYLAARLAVLESITGERRPTIILDDTFVSFDDMGRKQGAFELLQEIAKEYQVLYFTCHECPAGLEVVEI